MNKHNSHITPKVTVDIIIEIQDWHPFTVTTLGQNPFNVTLNGVNSTENREGIVLISRKNEPLGWALPGGFVDVGEKAIDAAVREALEETGLRVTALEQFHTYTDPKRDPRGHGITIVYIAKAIGLPKAADDAKSAIVVDPTNIGDTYIKALCFDHAQIITDYLLFKQTGERPTRE